MGENCNQPRMRSSNLHEEYWAVRIKGVVTVPVESMCRSGSVLLMTESYKPVSQIGLRLPRPWLPTQYWRNLLPQSFWLINCGFFPVLLKSDYYYSSIHVLDWRFLMVPGSITVKKYPKLLYHLSGRRKDLGKGWASKIQTGGSESYLRYFDNDLGLLRYVEKNKFIQAVTLGIFTILSTVQNGRPSTRNNNQDYFLCPSEL